MVCLIAPGSQPGSGPQLPLTTTTYDRYLQPATVTESTPAAGTLRTTTITYDGAGRVHTTAMSAGGLGQSLDTRRVIYDPATGQAIKSQTLDSGGNVTAEIVRGYDTLGRLRSYRDADGNETTTTYDTAGRPHVVNDGKATRTYTYDGGLEPRGMATSVVDSNVGMFTGTYDADGNLVTQTWPNGVHVTTTYNEVGAAVGITYTHAGCGLADCTLYTETNSLGVHGNVTSRITSFSSQAFEYDKAGRVKKVADTVSGQCTTRTYTYDGATNRTGRSTYGPGAGGACQDTTPAGATTWTYDDADRVTTSGYDYDALGRTISMPGEDTAAGTAGTVQIGYHANDMVRTIVSGGRTTSYTLDVTETRIRSWTDNGSGTTQTKTNHYAADTDSPVWTDEGDSGKYTRSIAGLGGIAAVHTATAGELWVVTNLHGDFVAGMPETGYGLAYVSEYNENGVPRNASAAGQRRYGWLGDAQRAADTPGGLLLMGRRLYAPGSGRFLSTDPVYGGNDNAYEYCGGDGVNCVDTTGAWSIGVSCRRTGRGTWGWWPWRYWYVNFRCDFTDRFMELFNDVGNGYAKFMMTLGAVIAAAGGLCTLFTGGFCAAAGGPIAIAGGIIAALGAIVDFVVWGIMTAYKWLCKRKRGVWFAATLAVRQWPRARPWAIPRGANCR